MLFLGVTRLPATCNARKITQRVSAVNVTKTERNLADDASSIHNE